MFDLPIFLNKFILTFKPIYRTPFWYWYRLVNHTDYRLDDHVRNQDFWYSINEKD